MLDKSGGSFVTVFRLGWPSRTRLYELDLPEVPEAKDLMIEDAGAKASCERRTVGVDLQQEACPEALLAAVH